jgi:hypothetical protein
LAALVPSAGTISIWKSNLGFNRGCRQCRRPEYACAAYSARTNTTEEKRAMPTFGPRNSLDQRRAQARASRQRPRQEVGVEIKQFYLTALDSVPVNFLATPTATASPYLRWRSAHMEMDTSAPFG